MDYSFFLRGALTLGERAVTAYERHVTVAEGRLKLDRDGPLPGELGPPPPPEAGDFAFHMPAADPGTPTQDALHQDLVLMQVENWTSPNADVTDLQRAQAEILIERARSEALERQVAELKAATKAGRVEVHLVGRGEGTPEEVERSTEVIRPRPEEVVKIYTEDWATKTKAASPWVLRLGADVSALSETTGNWFSLRQGAKIRLDDDVLLKVLDEVVSGAHPT